VFRESKPVIEEMDSSFPYPSPFSPSFYESDDFSKRFEQRINEMAQLQRGTEDQVPELLLKVEARH
jgi:hypothetical protein